MSSEQTSDNTQYHFEVSVSSTGQDDMWSGVLNGAGGWTDASAQQFISAMFSTMKANLPAGMTLGLGYYSQQVTMQTDTYDVDPATGTVSYTPPSGS